MAEFIGIRRYYLYKGRNAADRQDDAMASLWWTKQLEEAGTDLPTDFPSRDALVAAHYTTKEDLDGADCDELARHVRLTRREAEKVLAAAAAL